MSWFSFVDIHTCMSNLPSWKNNNRNQNKKGLIVQTPLTPHNEQTAYNEVTWHASDFW